MARPRKICFTPKKAIPTRHTPVIITDIIPNACALWAKHGITTLGKAQLPFNKLNALNFANVVVSDNKAMACLVKHAQERLSPLPMVSDLYPTYVATLMGLVSHCGDHYVWLDDPAKQVKNANSQTNAVVNTSMLIATKPIDYLRALSVSLSFVESLRLLSAYNFVSDGYLSPPTAEDGVCYVWQTHHDLMKCDGFLCDGVLDYTKAPTLYTIDQADELIATLNAVMPSNMQERVYYLKVKCP